MTTLTKIIIAFLILFGLIAHPVTRRLIFIILPLGRGWDDLLFWIALIGLITVLFIKGWVNLPKLPKFLSKIDQEEHQKNE